MFDYIRRTADFDRKYIVKLINKEEIGNKFVSDILNMLLMTWFYGILLLFFFTT